MIMLDVSKTGRADLEAKGGTLDDEALTTIHALQAAGRWHEDDRWHAQEYYYGYHYRAPPVVYGTPYNYGYYAPPVIYGAEPGINLNVHIP